MLSEIAPHPFPTTFAPPPVPFQATSRQTVHAQIGQYGYGTGYRLEFNPHKVRRAGIADILTVLGLIIPNQDPIGFLQHSTITRVDIAIDVPGLSLDDVIIRLSGARKHGVYMGQDSRPETVYLGGARGNRSAVYNKKVSKETSSLRIERRLKPRIFLSELISIPNPFLKVQVTATAPLRGLIPPIPDETLFDSMRLRGIRKALQFFEPDQRRILQDAINDPANSLMPSPEQIWQEWPQALEDVGLVFSMARWSVQPPRSTSLMPPTDIRKLSTS